MIDINKIIAGAAALAGVKPVADQPKRRRARGGRPASTYRGYRRNEFFGRKPVGNTKPHERFHPRSSL